MNIQEYHASPAVSNSVISRFLESPHLTHVPRKPTDALRWGNLVHTIVLEPHRCKTEWAVMPEGLHKGEGAKARAKEFHAANAGKEILKADEHASLLAIRDAVFADEMAGELLRMKGNRIEESFFWTHPKTGIKLRSRPDVITREGWFLDVKTTASIKKHKFNKAFFEYGYHRQTAMVSDALMANEGFRPAQSVFIAVKGDEAPEIFVQCFAVPSHVIETGIRHRDEALDQMSALTAKFGADSSKWPKRLCDDIIEIEQPAYID